MNQIPNSTSPISDGEWVDLFNGENLAGWRAFKGGDLPDRWTVRDGVLTLDPDLPGEVTDIVTEQSFDDFEFEMEWKVEPDQNSGIFIRLSEQYNQIWEGGPEMQIVDDELNIDGQNDITRAGAIYNIYPFPAGSSNSSNTWNQVRIIADGTQTSYYLNGDLVASFDVESDDYWNRVQASNFNYIPDFGRLSSGPIGFQDYNNNVQYRNIRIRSLNGTITPTPDPDPEPNPDPDPEPEPDPDAPTLTNGFLRFELEEGVLSNGALVSNEDPGFSGSGFVASWDGIGDNEEISASVQINEAGLHQIVLRYGRGAWSSVGQQIGDGEVALLVDGNFIQNVSLNTTTEWTDWQNSAAIPLQLGAGTHIITLRNPHSSSADKTQGVANFDYFDLTLLEEPTPEPEPEPEPEPNPDAPTLSDGFLRFELEEGSLSNGALFSNEDPGFSAGGFVASWDGIGDNEEVSATINITEAGLHQIVLRYGRGAWSSVGQLFGTGEVDLLLDGNFLETVALETAAEWTDWQNSAAIPLQLGAGTHTITLRNPYSSTADKNIGVANFDYFDLTFTGGTPPEPDPNVPTLVDGFVRLEWENGDPSNGASVSTEDPGYSGAGFIASWDGIDRNEEVSITVNVPQSGTHQLSLRFGRGNFSAVGPLSGNGAVELLIDGVSAESLPLATSESWTDWRNYEFPLFLQAGNRVLTLRNPYSSGQEKAIGVANFDYLDLTFEGATTPPPSEPSTVRLEFEDGTPENGAFVATDEPDYSGTGFIGGWDHLGTNETITLPFDAPYTGNYQFQFRYSRGPFSAVGALTGEGEVELNIDAAWVQTLTLLTQESWSEWKESAPASIYLTQGSHTVTLRHPFSEASDKHRGVANFDYLEITSPSGVIAALVTPSQSAASVEGVALTLDELDQENPHAVNISRGILSSRVLTEVDTTYSVQYSTDLSTWNTAFTIVGDGTTQEAQVANLLGGAPQAFVRIISSPTQVTRSLPETD